jgi:ubiquinone/menaquinone biosynthesis C-methylase UbiE
MLSRIREMNRRLNAWFFPRAELRYVDRFRALTESLAGEGGFVLHLGAGNVDLEAFLNRRVGKGRMLALDISLEVLRENTGHLKVCGDAGHLPLASQSVDLIVAEHVFEHFPQPRSCLLECYRVLKEGGRLVVSGPNGRSYVALLARLTPLAVHRLAHRLKYGHLTERADACPTYYRFSSPRTMRRTAGEAGFKTVSLERFAGEPCYTVFLPVIHLAFVAFHLAMEKLLPLVGCHMTAVAIFEKPCRAAVARNRDAVRDRLDYRAFPNAVGAAVPTACAASTLNTEG